ncbi:MAG: LytTR family DNA-binding domain-containing protein [Myxococcota bacterium]
MRTARAGPRLRTGVARQKPSRNWWAFDFVRIHRAELVNLAFVRAVDRRDGGTAVHLSSGEVVSVSRRQSHEAVPACPRNRRVGIPAWVGFGGPPLRVAAFTLAVRSW